MTTDQQPICDAVTEVAECLVEQGEHTALGSLLMSLNVWRWSPEAMLCFLLVSKREIARVRESGDEFPWFEDVYRGTVRRFAEHLGAIGHPDVEGVLALVRLEKS